MGSDSINRSEENKKKTHKRQSKHLCTLYIPSLKEQLQLLVRSYTPSKKIIVVIMRTKKYPLNWAGLWYRNGEPQSVILQIVTRVVHTYIAILDSPCSLFVSIKLPFVRKTNCQQQKQQQQLKRKLL